jgi:2,4-dienoyl-CoA reductase-like NADH-dependent reductase (Old Yellow Enzyme family)
MQNDDNGSILFTPVKIGSVIIPNRFVRSATHDFMADKNGAVTSRQVPLYRELAEGEIGLIISGHAYVDPQGKASPHQIGVYDDQQIEGLSLIADAVRPFPSKIFLQISHGGRQTMEKICGCTPVSPSAVYEPVFKVMPKEMTGSDIKKVIKDFIHASQRAKAAGFDGIQIHIAHGYLLSSFLSPHTNRRKDEWGGPLTNRLRVVVEIIKGIKDLLGEKYPLTVKLNSTDLLPNGLQLEEAMEAAKILENEGIDGIEVSGGMSEAGKASVWPGKRSEEKEGYFVEAASKIKGEVSIPVFGLGGIRSFSVMEKIITEKRADLVSMSRPFIRNPYLVKDYRLGKRKRAECISCNKCFNPRGIKCGDLERTKNRS